MPFENMFAEQYLRASRHESSPPRSAAPRRSPCLLMSGGLSQSSEKARRFNSSKAFPAARRLHLRSSHVQFMIAHSRRQIRRQRADPPRPKTANSWHTPPHLRQPTTADTCMAHVYGGTRNGPSHHPSSRGGDHALFQYRICTYSRFERWFLRLPTTVRQGGSHSRTILF